MVRIIIIVIQFISPMYAGRNSPNRWSLSSLSVSDPTSRSQAESSMSIIKTLEIPKGPNFRSKNKFKKIFYKTKELQADFQQFARSLMFWQVQNDESTFPFFTACSRGLPDNQQKVFKFLPP